MDASWIQEVRRFNRMVTQRVGALQDSYLSQGRPLGEARLIYEIGATGADIRDLRSRLSLDSGYLSRLLRSLEGQGLVHVESSPRDARVRRAMLTSEGRAEFDAYESRSDELALSILNPLDESQRRRLLSAMEEVRRLLQVAAIDIGVEPPGSADARWCLAEYFAELAARFEEGFDQTKGNTVSEAEMTPPAGYFLVARRGAEPVGCAALLRLSDETAEIKRMWTSPAARGQGLARRMLHKLEQIAREAGFRRLCLDTNRALKEAHALYRSEGFSEVGRYNDNPYADYWFEKRLAD
ncbi:bifunctional helix-turn-helix transcriptional regulator/GNAT family N-acetyltransferase [Arvimicrobium flavum]|uniref:bifunctional helix-turn-helix transcriptional regulator/GNAT family N-acetyltransferase n=1 Tax=Arvimicrobium flavum TaxID=3393320 RepID=UPI00237B8D6B|nr:helix-turn-helix domain-containing GNAT family N-acetyltransferase [Mesorhizobium shangrilense]